MHHIKDIIITVFPTLGGLITALEASNIILKVLVGGLTAIWLGFRIGIAYMEFKEKYKNR